MSVIGTALKHDSIRISWLEVRVKVSSQVYSFPIIQGLNTQYPGAGQRSGSVDWLSLPSCTSHTGLVLIQFKGDSVRASAAHPLCC